MPDITWEQLPEKPRHLLVALAAFLEDRRARPSRDELVKLSLRKSPSAARTDLGYLIEVGFVVRDDAAPGGVRVIGLP